MTRKEPLHEQIACGIREDITAGVLRPGQRLPSTRDLAGEWQVSAFTVNQAMDILAKEGLVESKSRSGRIVSLPAAQRNQLLDTAPVGERRHLAAVQALVDGLADGSVPDAALPSMAAVLTAAVTELARRTAQTADEHPGEKEQRG
jgi:DNA-binding transcriptional regulator YhcF (GntR family)